MARIHQLRRKARRMRKTADAAQYVLRLFTPGPTPRSTRALRNLSEICETNLKCRNQFEGIPICLEPGCATVSHIIAAPTLLKAEPLTYAGTVADRAPVTQDV